MVPFSLNGPQKLSNNGLANELDVSSLYAQEICEFVFLFLLFWKMNVFLLIVFNITDSYYSYVPYFIKYITTFLFYIEDLKKMYRTQGLFPFGCIMYF